MSVSTTMAVEDLEPLGRVEAATLAATEGERWLDLLGALEPEDWHRPTDCPDWDVRAVAGHVLGMLEAFASWREFLGQMRAAGAAAKRGEVFIDAMTARQVAQRADLTTEELIGSVAAAVPRNARWRRRFPLRRLTMEEEVAGEPETWRMGYLVDVILNRDPWMHRVDVSRATGRPMVLTEAHDGRLVADAVAEWARRHGRPVTLVLGGPAGGRFTAAGGGEELALDAVEFCRILSGRASGTGLLAQEVPF